MANLLVTQVCNRNCSYCFAVNPAGVAGAAGEAPDPPDYIDATDFEQIVSFFRRSHLSVVGLLGGEPGLHPGLPDMVRRLRDEGFHVRIFTGGLISRELAGFLACQDPAGVRIVVNVPGQGDLKSPREEEWFRQTLQQLSGLGTLGYTIRDPHESLCFLAEMGVEFGLRGPLRLGLACPRIEDPSPAMLPPAVYPLVARRVLELAEACAPRHIPIEFDCGFTWCMFTPQEHERLKTLNVKTGFTCSPIIDIGTDLAAWSCFPLQALEQVQIEESTTRQELVSRFWKRQRAYRNLGVYERCLDCAHKSQGECAGGSLAHVIRSFPCF